MELNELIRRFNALRQLNISNSLPTLLYSKVQPIHVYQELGQIEELGYDLTHIRHLSNCVLVALGNGGEKTVWNVEFSSLELFSCLSIGLNSDKELYDDGEVRVVEPEMILVAD